ncbi:hypothetical protein RH858_11315 [Halalkaliarchaeum sp. AArc-GB]|uniref:hypothetical protein n=1 Tax=Halalkaliarchaeum sp. AArc-GB TaxID=3074078 RepID=UPI0028640507|nr:hypothetical protein [Halalkaliarchaeum sp. AArc-GB]MDR5673730.1 hypothetical protein [Halalkaliarchaeum sp. AArc-GB]
MSHSETKQSWVAQNGWWRAVAAAVVAVVGTAALLVAFDRIPTMINSWEPIAVGHLTREVSYHQFNSIWLLVRAAIGLYISVVFVIIAGQLVGHWRRYVIEGGEQ